MHQDRKAQNELYDLLYSSLMAIATRYNDDYQDAKSSVNMGFVRIILNLDKYKPEVPFLAWARRVMINNVINEYRSKNKDRRLSVVYNDFSDHQNIVTDYSEDIYDNELTGDEVAAVLKKLPSSQATVFNLFAIDGYTHEEIAELLNITQSTSRWHLMNARKFLQEQLAKKKSNNKALSAS